ncbi:MAG: cysteine peptidase family C39 domain-containing protein [Flavobacteriales bacterium]
MGFKFFSKYDHMDCGPACLQMIAQHYGKHYSLQYLRKKSFLSHDVVSLLGINKTAQDIRSGNPSPTTQV